MNVPREREGTGRCIKVVGNAPISARAIVLLTVQWATILSSDYIMHTERERHSHTQPANLIHTYRARTDTNMHSDGNAATYRTQTASQQ